MGLSSCRFCGTRLQYTFVNLGLSPLANAYLNPEQLDRVEPVYPLHAYVCRQCFLVQLEEFENPGHIFSDYAYFSSYSSSLLNHAKLYAESMVQYLGLSTRSQIVEIGSNDGYLLQYFLKKNIPVLGIEPAGNVANVAIEKGIPTQIKFFGSKLAQDLVKTKLKADLIIGNNVLAHVPTINDFVEGLKVLLRPDGVVTMEFPHLMKLIADQQFDTIYHEHFSYFSFLTVEKIFAKHGLKLFDVEEIPTHGGSLRIYACHCENQKYLLNERVSELQRREQEVGILNLEYYRSFAEKVQETKRSLLEFFINANRKGKSVVGYGAPAKGNTLLNYCGIRTDFLPYTVDRSPHKQNCYLPGTRIPIYRPEVIRETKPDYVLILAWNLKDEVMEQMHWIRDWGGQFVTPIPEVTIHP